MKNLERFTHQVLVAIAIGVVIIATIVVAMATDTANQTNTTTNTCDQLTEVEARLDEVSQEIAQVYLDPQNAMVLREWAERFTACLAGRTIPFGYNENLYTVLEPGEGDPDEVGLYFATEWYSDGYSDGMATIDDEMAWPFDPTIEGADGLTDLLVGMRPGEIRAVQINHDNRFIVMATKDVGSLRGLKTEFMSLYVEWTGLWWETLSTMYGNAVSDIADDMITMNGPYPRSTLYRALAERIERYYRRAKTNATTMLLYVDEDFSGINLFDHSSSATIAKMVTLGQSVDVEGMKCLGTYMDKTPEIAYDYSWALEQEDTTGTFGVYEINTDGGTAYALAVPINGTLIEYSIEYMREYSGAFASDCWYSWGNSGSDHYLGNFKMLALRIDVVAHESMLKWDTDVVLYDFLERVDKLYLPKREIELL